MRPFLLDLLACPFCGSQRLALTVVESSRVADTPSPACRRHCALEGPGPQEVPSPCRQCRTTEILSGVLGCGGCGRWYPIREGIASIMPDDLRDPGEAALLDGWRGALPAAVYERALAAPSTTTAPRRETHTASRDKLAEIKLRDSESDVYDQMHPDDKFRAEFETYDEIFVPTPGGILLDLGCGTGRVSRHLLGKTAVLVGADYSFESLRYFRRRLDPAQLATVPLVQADACHLPFRAGVFDAVVSTAIFYHLPGQAARDQALRCVAGVLRDGGDLLISALNFGLVKRLRGRLGLAKAGHKEGHKNSGVYYYHHSPAEFLSWIEPHFQVTELRGTDNRVPILHRLSPAFNAWLDRNIGHSRLSLPVFAREMVAHGRKRHGEQRPIGEQR